MPRLHGHLIWRESGRPDFPPGSSNGPVEIGTFGFRRSRIRWLRLLRSAVKDGGSPERFEPLGVTGSIEVGDDIKRVGRGHSDIRHRGRWFEPLRIHDPGSRVRRHVHEDAGYILSFHESRKQGAHVSGTGTRGFVAGYATVAAQQIAAPRKIRAVEFEESGRITGGQSDGLIPWSTSAARRL